MFCFSDTETGQEMNFNIHNLLFLKIKGMNKRYLNYLGREYSFFKTGKEVDPDVEIIIADSVNPDDDCRLVDNKYFIKEGYLYCKDSYKVARWTLSIDGLEGKTVVHFGGGFWGEHVLKEFVIEPLLGFKLATKGFSILHASAMAINDKGFIFAGGPETGKTASILSLSFHDNVFLSDEIAFLSRDGTVYGFPSSIRICLYRLKGMNFVYRKMKPQQKLEMRLKHFAHILSLGYAAFPSDISANKFFQKMGGVYPLHCLVILTKTSGEDISITEIANKKELVERLVLINEQQYPYWCKYVSAYSFVYPSSQVALYSQLMADNLSQALDKIACYEIKTPHKFSKDHSDKFQQVIQTLGKVS